MHACHCHGPSPSHIRINPGIKTQNPLRCIHAYDKNNQMLFIENGVHDFPHEMEFDEDRRKLIENNGF